MRKNMSDKPKTAEAYDTNESHETDPVLIRKIYFLYIFDEREDKPSDHYHEK